MRARPFPLFLVAASLVAGGSALATSGPVPGTPPATSAGAKAPRKAAARASARIVHPDVGGEQECAACHETGTPEVFQAWHGSRHGMSLVKCVVCHGSTGKDFARRAPAERCRGCHGDQVDSLARTGVKDCFACHAPHTLAANPHRR